MKSVHLPSTKEEKDATRTIQKGSKRAPLKAIRDNLYASHLIDFKRLGPTVREYLKCATEAGENKKQYRAKYFLCPFF